MIIDEYFQKQKETSSAVDTLIKRYIADLEDTTAQLPAKRIGHPRLRDMSTRLGYELQGGRNWSEIVPIAAAFEFENCSSYVINWIFDEKGGKKSKEEVNNLIVAGMRLRELADKVLRDSNLEKLVSCIHDINFNGYDGQFRDLNMLKVQNMNRYPTDEEFFKAYEERCRLLSGIFHGHCLSSGSHILGAPSQKLYAIGERFGRALQASNDIGDFAIPSKGQETLEKPYNDQFSDFKQGKLTLPTYLLLTRASDDDRKTLESKIGKEEITPSDAQEILDIMSKTRSLKYCLNYLKTKNEEAKRMLYESFPKSPARNLVAQMLTTIVSNKFIYALKSSQKENA